MVECVDNSSSLSDSSSKFPTLSPQEGKLDSKIMTDYHQLLDVQALGLLIWIVSGETQRTEHKTSKEQL